MAIRIYLSALIFLFLFLVWFSRGVGVLEATVVVSALLYLILDTREHLRIARTELDLLARSRLVVACGGGAVAVRGVQPAGKTRIPVGDWVRGRGIAAGQRFE